MKHLLQICSEKKDQLEVHKNDPFTKQHLWFVHSNHEQQQQCHTWVGVRQQQIFCLSLVSGGCFLPSSVEIYVPPIESPLFGLLPPDPVPAVCVLVVSYLRMYSFCDTAPPSSCEKAYPPCSSKSSEAPLPPPAAVPDVPGRLPPDLQRSWQHS